ncbi:hypothetical protein HP397_01590 [Streptobacillus felis]|uniref:Tox-REase-7 domain-containing protein n=1 Tax=Streptobacillus felis TaxID=1384509 RepID=A0A7Z0PE30_9FUSO|nr:putative toxin [Streptobacillus felis]NYV27521.1 hypothetical protein [Streptobacillus felis]
MIESGRVDNVLNIASNIHKVNKVISGAINPNKLVYVSVGLSVGGSNRRANIESSESLSSRIDVNKKKEKIESLTNTAIRRYPDELLNDEKVLREIKNVSRLRYTNQIKDFNLWAKENGYKFILEPRLGVKLSSSLEKEIEKVILYLSI